MERPAAQAIPHFHHGGSHGRAHQELHRGCRAGGAWNGAACTFTVQLQHVHLAVAQRLLDVLGHKPVRDHNTYSFRIVRDPDAPVGPALQQGRRSQHSERACLPSAQGIARRRGRAGTWKLMSLVALSDVTPSPTGWNRYALLDERLSCGTETVEGNTPPRLRGT